MTVLCSNSTGRVSIHKAVIRQATIGYSGGGSGLSIENTLIHSCENGIQISGGVGENIIPVLIKDTEVILNKRGILLHGTKTAPYISIQRSNISKNDYHGIQIQNWDDVVTDADADTSFVITDSSFESNGQSGFQTEENLPSDLQIKNCTFKGNSRYGLYFNRYYPNNIGQTVLSISKCYFIENSYGGIYLYSTRGGPTNIAIRDSNFETNKQRAIYLSFDPYIDYNDTVINIYNNTISSHSYSYYPFEIHQRSKSFRLTINENEFRENRGAIDIRGYGGQMRFAVINNKFQNISDVSKGVIKVSNALLEFTNNIIENATTGTLIEIGNGYDHLITNNSFISDEAVTCFVDVNSPFETDKLIKVADNFWGTDHLPRIKEKICDFFTNVQVARVQVQSYFVDSTLNVKQDSVSEDMFVQAAFADGSYLYEGILNGTVLRPQYTNGTIFVNRSIIIGDAGKLEFAGSRIIFAENRGVIIKGNYCGLLS